MSPAAHAVAKKSRTSGSSAAWVRGRTVRFGYVPSLDGLRALAVLGVMMYHGGALGGGFLTIDVFFVLSGFLITSLLVGEWHKRLTIRLGQFWARRARRLLPALLVMLLGVAVYAKVLATPGEFANLRLDVLSTLFYVANWHFIVAGSNYFNQTGTASPLAHMWSLSIEEQFYIVWPPVVLFMLHLGGKLRASRRLWPLFATAVGGAIASAVDMRLLYHGPASVMRIYEGTDTRSQDLLVGAALAVGMTIWAQHRPALPAWATNTGGVPGATRVERRGRAHTSTAPVGEPTAGLVARLTAGPIVGLTTSLNGVREASARRRGRHSIRQSRACAPIDAWEVRPVWVRALFQLTGWGVVAVFAYLWSHLSLPTSFLYRGGYFVVALGVAAVIFCSVTNEAGALSRALGNRLFRYVGKISYGAYLWHFPLFAILDASRMHVLGIPLLAVRMGTTLLVASGSYYLVEEPIRRGKLRSLAEWRAWIMTSGAFVAVIAATVVATMPTVADAASSHPAAIGSRYSGPPVSAVILGDSVAWRLGAAMLLAQPLQRYDVNLDNAAIIGCGVVRSTEYRSHGVVDAIAPPCNPTTPISEQWPALWKGELARVHPNVTVLLAGRWEVTDRLINGQWMHIGQPAFDAILKQSLEQAVQVGTSTGASMILMTSPCFASGEQPNGQPWPEDSAVRLAEYNAMVYQVARGHPTNVVVDNFGAQLCPGGHFQTFLDGVQIRDADGVHIVPTAAAGQWLAARVLPEVNAVGQLQRAGRSLRAAVSPASPSVSPASPSVLPASSTTPSARGPGSIPVRQTRLPIRG